MVDAAGMDTERCQRMDRGNAAEKTVWSAVSGGAWHCLLSRVARRQGLGSTFTVSFCWPSPTLARHQATIAGRVALALKLIRLEGACQRWPTGPCTSRTCDTFRQGPAGCLCWATLLFT